jgi:hypothetical protein
MKTILCCEAGFECDYVVKSQTEEEDIKNGREYAMKRTWYEIRRHNYRMKEKSRAFVLDT